MPNHVITVIQASQNVIDKLFINNEVDFSTVIPMPEGLDDGSEGFGCYAESMAKRLFPLFRCGMDVSEQMKDLREDEKQECLKFLNNKKQFGYYHSMDFQKEEWGTKWNGYHSFKKENVCVFQTAWNSPFKVINALSLMFPEEQIVVTYADEDCGHNCGIYAIKNGVIVSKYVAEWNHKGNEFVEFANRLWEKSNQKYFDNQKGN